MILCVLFFSPVSHSKICQPLPFKETQRIKECLIILNQNGARYFKKNPKKQFQYCSLLKYVLL